MKKNLLKILLTTSAYFLVASGYTPASPAGGLVAIHAQTTPQFLVSWRSDSYAPPAYQGKILPTRGSAITLAMELVDQQKIADLSRKEIRWFFNNRLLQSGIGLKKVIFNLPANASGNQIIKVVVRDYQGADLTKIAFLPAVEPEILIDAPFPDQKMPAALNTLIAQPYFFNINTLNDLIVAWTVNGIKTPSGALNQLNIDLSQGRPKDQVSITVTAINKLNGLESANQYLNLEIK